MGPFSGVMFLVGMIMVFAARDRNNDELYFEEHRTEFMIEGIFLITAAVAIWIYLAVKGEPKPLPDYTSLMNRNSSQ